jgi:hypothetical protein
MLAELLAVLLDLLYHPWRRSMQEELIDPAKFFREAIRESFLQMDACDNEKAGAELIIGAGSLGYISLVVSWDVCAWSATITFVAIERGLLRYDSSGRSARLLAPLLRGSAILEP